MERATIEAGSSILEQVTGAVRWRESVAWMADQGVTEFWEIGAGKALSGMIKRIQRDASLRAIGRLAAGSSSRPRESPPPAIAW